MMRALCAALAVAAAALSWGCSTGAGRPGMAVLRLEAVKVGMTADQVADAVGRPQLIEPHGGPDGTEVWYYDDGIVILDGSTVTNCFPAAAPQT